MTTTILEKLLRYCERTRMDVRRGRDGTREADDDGEFASDAGRRRRGGRLDVFVARRGTVDRIAAPGAAPRGAQYQQQNPDDEVGR